MSKAFDRERRAAASRVKGAERQAQSPSGAAESDDDGALLHIKMLEQTDERLDRVSAALETFGTQLTQLAKTQRAAVRANQAFEQTYRRHAKAISAFTTLFVITAVVLVYGTRKPSGDPSLRAPRAAVADPSTQPAGLVSPGASQARVLEPSPEPRGTVGWVESETGSRPMTLEERLGMVDERASRIRRPKDATPAEQEAEVIVQEVPETITQEVAGFIAIEAAEGIAEAALPPHAAGQDAGTLTSAPPVTASVLTPPDTELEDATTAYRLMEAALYEAAGMVSAVRTSAGTTDTDSAGEVLLEPGAPALTTPEDQGEMLVSS